jgi:hypothetical protein
MRLSRLEFVLAAACVLAGAVAIIVNAIGLAQYLAG